jgi:surfactin synthase thioesterase subunit
MLLEESHPKWVFRPRVDPMAWIRLFCFPYAGAGASTFFAWAELLPKGVELCAVQLPGRENRIGEKPLTSVQAIVQEAAAGLLPFLDRPVALFGHSMGALIAFELANHWEQHRQVDLRHLFVSGHDAPQLPAARKTMHLLPDGEFLRELMRINGMAPEILADENLMEILLPVLRADFRVAETYRCAEGARRLSCPISALGGLKDEFVSPDRLAAWRGLARSAFSQHLFPGDHFYIRSDRGHLIGLMAKKLAAYAPATGLGEQEHQGAQACRDRRSINRGKGGQHELGRAGRQDDL